ncbi:HEAT repeat domain-containing protein [Verrucomicrobiaceae bacterium 5K15]|uniref:HEAT repeat domain-containing protein n=1 Tax=Oceaniferula flava TaxID=2800421 RepID=A0AAE2SCJ8_9BACT|nr:DUF6288 domain-containing protein [Oceaniferula flavus]MBK1854887.1 HEAT repeat domain-containing protein [Oceaniferula flavus]MBM1136193.1 HEAT repeat domain-containing protein [Oceaniferula flavus]
MIAQLTKTTACLALLSLAPFAQGARLTEQPVPDFTKGDPIGERHDWNLGPTGARGWMWGWKLQTTKARQIYVTQVDAGSPADGVLAQGDVILGVGGKDFSSDARIAFGNAITAAEATDGKLLLNVWKKGKTSQVTLQLPALGAYGDALLSSEKSQKIVDAGCKHMAERLERELADIDYSSWVSKRGPRGYSSREIMNTVDALALLASGKPEYADLVKQYAHLVAPQQLNLPLSPTVGMASWGWGYINLFLCEYHLATADDFVLPAIEKYSTSIAKGQSFIGSWGHAMAWPVYNQGKIHGSLGGYGALNSAGLICHMSMVMAEKCGVQNAEISQAIEKANKFMGFYAGKGAIPYGDHFPGWDRHDDNGKNSMAAVIFDLQNMRDKAQFFAHMSVASYGERERGHTGNYFSYVWGPLGTQRVGTEATEAFMKKQLWFYDMNRAWDGSFPYQGGANSGKGEHSYKGWDATGAFVLSYTLPLKKLHITGKSIDASQKLTGSKLASVIEAGAGFSNWDEGTDYFVEKSPEELIAALKSWSPAVRFRAAAAIAKKEGGEKLIPELITMLESDSLTTRYGACQGLGALNERAAAAVKPLQSLLWEKDAWLRIQAASALANIGEASKSAIPALLKLAITESDADPLQITQRYIAFGLFDARGVYGKKGLLSKSLKDIDRDLLYKAVQKILTNPDGRTRGTVGSVYKTLSFEELKPLLPAIVKAIEEPSPSGVMFSNDIRLQGVEMLAHYKVREGMALCLQILEIDKWGKRRRISKSLDVLASYGGAAKPVIPQLHQLEKDLLVHPEAKGLTPQIEQVRKLINDIETAKTAVKLRTLD